MKLDVICLGKRLCSTEKKLQQKFTLPSTKRSYIINKVQVLISSWYSTEWHYFLRQWWPIRRGNQVFNYASWQSLSLLYVFKFICQTQFFQNACAHCSHVSGVGKGWHVIFWVCLTNLSQLKTKNFGNEFVRISAYISKEYLWSSKWSSKYYLQH